jgi:ATP-binding cassette subfamily F protein uup
VVKDFVGNYTEYRTFIKDYEKQMADQVGHDAAGNAGSKKKPVMPDSDRASKRKLTWKEQQELKALEEKLPQLEAEKAELESKLSSGTLDAQQLQEASTRYGSLQDELDAAEMRWLELSE